MNLHHLKVFLAVAETGAISAGAERLHISQPAVTREIRELEGRLGLPLFDRQPRGVTLTEAGQRLLAYAEARRQIYLPAYRWVLDCRLQPEVAHLRTLAAQGPVVLLDYETNADIDNLARPLSHAALVIAYLRGAWPA